MKKAKNVYEHLFKICSISKTLSTINEAFNTKKEAEDFLCKHYKCKNMNDLCMKMMKKGLYE